MHGTDRGGKKGRKHEKQRERERERQREGERAPAHKEEPERESSRLVIKCCCNLVEERASLHFHDAGCYRVSSCFQRRVAYESFAKSFACNVEPLESRTVLGGTLGSSRDTRGKPFARRFPILGWIQRACAGAFWLAPGQHNGDNSRAPQPSPRNRQVAFERRSLNEEVGWTHVKENRVVVVSWAIRPI